MLEGKIIRIIKDREHERVKYVCRGEKNLTFVCGEDLGAYYYMVYNMGDIWGCEIKYDQEKDKIMTIWKDDYL